MAGLRLPTGNNAATLPLYAKTGQQFTLPTTFPSNYGITLSLATAAPWLTLANPRYVFPDDLTAFITNLSGLNTHFPPTAPDLTTTPELLPLYVDEPRRYNLQQEVPWTSLIDGVTTLRSLLDLPDNLRSFLATQPNGVTLALKSGNPAPGTPMIDQTSGTPMTDQKMKPLDSFTWGTRIKLTVRHIAEASDQIYLMVGMNETDKDLLEEVWNHLQSHTGVTPKLYLLYANDKSSANVDAQAAGLMNGAIANNLLLKTNLSTQSNPAGVGMTLLATAVTAPNADPYSATLNDAQTFIQLLWEGSTVNSGGYYLHYTETGNKGLPAHLFTDGLNASLVLLVVLEPLGHSAAPIALPFHNCVVLKDRQDPANTVLIAESKQTVKALQVPPGNAGFQLTRSLAIDEIKSTDPTVLLNRGNIELLNLYQTLGYFLQDPQTPPPAATKACPSVLPNCPRIHNTGVTNGWCRSIPSLPARQQPVPPCHRRASTPTRASMLNM